MTYIEWTTSLSVGSDEIDGQHATMLGIINTLFETVTHRDNTEELRRITANLMAYTQEHFITEEGLMRGCGFPGLAEHQQEHIHFMEKIRDFAMVLENEPSGAVLPLEMFHFLQTWLAEHIMRVDRQYAVFCNMLGGGE